jgi:hypothetical protein
MASSRLESAVVPDLANPLKFGRHLLEHFGGLLDYLRMSCGQFSMLRFKALDALDEFFDFAMVHDVWLRPSLAAATDGVRHQGGTCSGERKYPNG